MKKSVHNQRTDKMDLNCIAHLWPPTLGIVYLKRLLINVFLVQSRRLFLPPGISVQSNTVVLFLPSLLE